MSKSPPPRPHTFPQLPEYRNGIPWGSKIQLAHQKISDVYEHAARLLTQEDSDPLRLDIQLEQRSLRSVPLLRLLAPEVNDEEWSTRSTEALVSIMCDLHRASQAVRTQ